MRNHRDPVAALAARQHGVITARQLEELGVPVTDGLHRVHPGVYALDDRPLTAEARGTAAVFAALLSLGTP